MFVSSLFDKEKKKKKKGEFFKEALYLGTQIKKKGTEGRDLLGGDFEFDGCVVVFLSHGFSITIDEAEKKKSSSSTFRQKRRDTKVRLSRHLTRIHDGSFR